ncbi:MAG: sensor histidine kinase [Lachnospiraceae bacterium]
MPEWMTDPRLLLMIGDFLTIYLYGYMQKSFYEKRAWAKKYRYLLICIYAIDWCLLFAANMLEIPPVNLMAMILSYLVPLFVCYQVKSVRGLAYYLFYLTGTMAMEIGLGVTGGYLNNNIGFHIRYDLITPQTALIMNFLEIIWVLIICKFGNKDKNSKYDKITFWFMIMPILSLALIVIEVFSLAMGVLEDFNSEQFLGTTVLLLVVNIVMFIILEKYTDMMKREMELMQEKVKLKSDADIMEIAARKMKENLAAAEQIIQKDRLMRHDRRHFESLMLSLLQEGKTEEAKKCLEERLSLEPQNMERFCENTTVNAALSHYIAQAKKKEIRVLASANIPSALQVDEMELAITISNLLENAIHACEKLPEAERYIRFKAKYKNQLLLEIENSCDGTARLDEDGYPCTPEKGHGIGTRSVLAFVKKTESEIHYSMEGNIFQVRMIVGV